MNIAEMLAQRMKSPGSMANFADRTDQPGAAQAVQDQSGGAMVAPDGNDDAGAVVADVSEDGGLGMLSSAHKLAHGKSKAALGKAIAHGKAKHAKGKTNTERHEKK
jgi:hypothetical protein